MWRKGGGSAAKPGHFRFSPHFRVIFGKFCVYKRAPRNQSGIFMAPGQKGTEAIRGIGRGSRARTRDLRFWRPSLYQLSYTPAVRRCYLLSPPPSSGGQAAARDPRHTCRSTIIFLISAMAFAGFRPLGQVLVQFMIVWQSST